MADSEGFTSPNNDDLDQDFNHVNCKELIEIDGGALACISDNKVDVDPNQRRDEPANTWKDVIQMGNQSANNSGDGSDLTPTGMPQKEHASPTKSVDDTEYTWKEMSYMEDGSLANESSKSQAGLTKAIERPRNYSKVTSLVIVVLVMASVGYGAYAIMRSKGIVLKKPDESNNESFVGEVSLAELALHNTPGDCWLELHGNVYDLTEYATQHPGGATFITNLAGSRATSQYSLYHDKRLLDTIPGLMIGRLETSEDPSESTSEDITEAPLRQISLDEIALHSFDNDLWVALHGQVFNLTDYAPIHPGGLTFITGVAGSDGSKSFDDFHNVSQLVLIEQYKIGVLSDSSTNQAPSTYPVQGESFEPVGVLQQAPTVSPSMYVNLKPEEETEKSPVQSPPADAVMQQTPAGSPVYVEPVIIPYEQLRKITLDEIALHNTEKDQWIAMHGLVYDMTIYAPFHPGGAIFITGVAGTDATVAFDDFHPMNYLSFVRQHAIGVLSEEETNVFLEAEASPFPNGSPSGAADSGVEEMPIPVPQSAAMLPPTVEPTTEQDSACLLRMITMEEIKQHRKDSWVLIYQRVYDLSTYNHPGGNAIIARAVGTNATDFYETEHPIDLLYDETMGIQHFMIGKVGTEAKLVNKCTDNVG